MDKTYDFGLKLVFAGDTEVGKTSLMKVFISGKMPEKSVVTVVAEYESKVLTLADGRLIKAGVWDTAGQERYRSLSIGYFRRAQGAIVVYDVNRRSSFDQVSEWVANIRSHAPDAVILLIGNKMDLYENTPLRERVPEADHLQLVAAEGINVHVRLSALNSNAVNDAFLRLAEEIMKSNVGRLARRSSEISITPNISARSNNTNNKKQNDVSQNCMGSNGCQAF
eukprot:GDKJ01005952.1.p1 GENE.GDKJ01005952.1~~GDKJ01005952.1.p1  ORF type:complete len:224 (+),score=22.69 GDKJ01005952.1:43-714(+)